MVSFTLNIINPFPTMRDMASVAEMQIFIMVWSCLLWAKTVDAFIWHVRVNVFILKEMYFREVQGICTESYWYPRAFVTVHMWYIWFAYGLSKHQKHVRPVNFMFVCIFKTLILVSKACIFVLVHAIVEWFIFWICIHIHTIYNILEMTKLGCISDWSKERNNKMAALDPLCYHGYQAFLQNSRLWSIWGITADYCGYTWLPSPLFESLYSWHFTIFLKEG